MKGNGTGSQGGSGYGTFSVFYTSALDSEKALHRAILKTVREFVQGVY